MATVAERKTAAEKLASYDAAMKKLMYGLGPVLAALRYEREPAEAWRFPDGLHVVAVCEALLVLDSLGDKT